MPHDPVDAALRNLVLLQRVGNGLTADARARLRTVFDELAAEIARHDPTSVSPRYRQARVEKLMVEVEAIVGDGYSDVLKQARQSLAELGAQQGRWAASTLQAATGYAIDIRQPMGVNLAKAIIDRDPFMGLVMADWVEATKQSTIRNVRRQVQLGMLQNEPVGDMVRRVRGKSDGRGGFVGGVLESSTRQAEAIVRTAVNDIANTSHIRTYRANSDVVTQVEWTSVLDSRTSPICQARDGDVYDVTDETAPRPPAHYNCRSVLTPVIDWDSLGIDAPPESTRASAGGQVKASTTYQTWLEAQPASVQDDILGPGRGRLFREGVSLKDMVKRDGTIVRLADLPDGP